MQNYASLQETHDPDEESGVVMHTVDPNRSKWNHIKDLDSFFSRMYQYHQKHGFLCMFLQEWLELVQFVFIVVLTIYVSYGIDYPVLFRDTLPRRINSTIPNNNYTKVTLNDVFLPFGECVSHFDFYTWLALLIAVAVWILKLVKGVYQLFHFWDIKQFYNLAMKVADDELDNLTWHDIQAKLKAVQVEQRICIHTPDLTELDIYHRILRQQNYLVAMVNKRLLPPRIKIPFYGEMAYWTVGLRFNMQVLLFWSPWSPFAHPWQLREDYKRPSMRKELAKEFGWQVVWLIGINLVFAPIIFIWQLLYAFFTYAALIRKEPSVLAVRRWSLYGRLYLRHFNELEHELQARLTRAHRPATKYLGAFTSPIGTIISENIGFYAASILAVFLVLSIIDEDVLAVEHVLTIITALSIAVAVLRSMSVDETMPSDLEGLLKKVVEHTHYLPSNWAGQAHTARVRKEFEHLFQYSFVSLIETILSPILTPYVLWRHILPRSLEFVDFFRNFTVTVTAVGDVCSFAQMDVRRHGNPEWQPEDVPEAPNQYLQGEDGKVELSLIHFKYTNPNWQPPQNAQEFVRNVQDHSSMVASGFNDDFALHRNLSDVAPRPFRVGEVVDDVEGPEEERANLETYSSEIWRSRASHNFGASADAPEHLHMSNVFRNEGPDPASIREMALSATYLHAVHNNRTENRPRNTANETSPLLRPNR